MNTAVKVIGAVAVLVAVLAVAAFLLIANRADTYIVDAVETYGEAATGTPVDLDGAAVSLTEGRGMLTGLTIANPEGFETPNALEIDDIDLRVDLGSLGADALVVSDVLVDGARLQAEQRGERNNLAEILDNLGADDSEADAESAGRIIIERFRLTGGRIDMTAEGLDSPQTLDLGDVVVEGIGRSTGGVGYEEAADTILGAILTEARSALGARLQDAAGEAVRREVEEEVRGRLDELRRDED